MDACDLLIDRLVEARAHLSDLIARVPRDKQIFPNWTLKEFIAHLSGWDDSTIEALKTHALGGKVEKTVARGIDAYNVVTVSSRKPIGLDQILEEWQATRRELIQALRDLPDEKFNEPLAFPWGGSGTVTQFIEVFIEHEEEHAEHLHRWLKHPDQPLAESH